MGISLSQINNVGLTVESDPLALKLTGGTLTGKLVTTATATTAPLNVAVATTPPTTTVAGDVWVGTGNIFFKDSAGTQRACLTNNQPTSIDISSATLAALRITQRGTANAFEVEDSTNVDSTSFVITNSGVVGIGVPSSGWSPVGLSLLNVSGVIQSTAITFDGITSFSITGQPKVFSGLPNTHSLPVTIDGVNYHIHLSIV